MFYFTNTSRCIIPKPLLLFYIGAFHIKSIKNLHDRLKFVCNLVCLFVFMNTSYQPNFSAI